MKVIMVCPSFRRALKSPKKNFGGIERHLTEISIRLVKMGYNIEIYTTSQWSSSSYSTVVENIPVRVFPSIVIREAYYLSIQQYKALQTAKCDILHAHGAHAFPFLFTCLAKKPTQKFVATLHSSATSNFGKISRVPYERLVLRRLLKKADKIICVSNSEFKQFSNKLSLPSSRFQIINNAGDRLSYKSITWPDKIPEGTRYILSVGRLVPFKGHFDLIKSFKILKQHEPDIKLVIVGSGTHKEQLIQLINKLKLNDSVHIMSQISDEYLLSLYKNCIFFSLLSKYEGQALTPLEALYAKKPILVTYVPSLNEFVDKGLAIGVSYPPNPEKVARKMKSILNSPDDYFPKDAIIPTWDTVTKELDHLYNSVIG